MIRARHDGHHAGGGTLHDWQPAFCRANHPSTTDNLPSSTANRPSSTANQPFTTASQPSAEADRTGRFGAMTKKNAI